MKFKLNPLTGEFDYTSESANKQKLNPLTGEFNLVEGDGPFSQIFNPLTGSFNLGQGGGLKPIPAGYARIEYLESNGNQYIDTGLTLNNKSKVEIKFKSSNTTITQGLFGSRDNTSGDNRNAFAVWENVGARMRYDFQSNPATPNNVISTNDWNTFIKDGVTNVLNGVLEPSNTAATFENNYSAYIFSINSVGTATAGMVGSIEYCIVYQDGKNVSFYGVPCVNSLGVPGMFDRVSGNFFTNDGTGNFAVGPFVLPEEYTKDEYFQCPVLPYTGYVGINTGILPRYNMDICVDYSVYNSSSVYVFGARESGGTQQMTFSGSQNGGTITSYVGGNYVAAQTGSTKWARIGLQENRYKIITHIDSEPGYADVSFTDVINERTDNQNFTFTPSIFEANQIPMYIGGNGREPETSTTRIHEVNISWTEDGQLNIRVFVPASHGDKHGFYEVFTKHFLHY